MSRRYERFMKARLEQQAQLARHAIEPIDWEEPEPLLGNEWIRKLLVIVVMVPWALLLIVWVSAEQAQQINVVVDDPYGEYIGELLERK